LIGVAPLLARLRWHPPGIPLRCLELLGTGEAEADEICSDHLGMIAERGREDAVADTIARGLARGVFGSWDELVLRALDADDLASVALVPALARAGIGVEQELTGACPYIALPSSFEAYVASLSPSHRFLVRRSLRDFERWAEGTDELHVARTRAELEKGRRILESLHAERWRSEGHSGVFTSGRFSSFHDEVMPALLEQGALDLSWLSVRGTPIAAAYSIIWNGKVSFYQSGRSLDVPKGIRPGIVLHAKNIERAIRAGLREYDFLAGTSQYKLDLASDTRPIASLRGARPSLRELARKAVDRAKSRLRRFGRPIALLRANTPNGGRD
jgi:CelD/BcsL family acetyltransferase involved in cellulose biosynthesis